MLVDGNKRKSYRANCKLHSMDDNCFSTKCSCIMVILSIVMCIECDYKISVYPYLLLFSEMYFSMK